MHACVIDSLYVFFSGKHGKTEGLYVCVRACYLPLDLLMLMITCGWKSHLYAISYCRWDLGALGVFNGH
jgi:hypothetical protein